MVQVKLHRSRKEGSNCIGGGKEEGLQQASQERGFCKECIRSLGRTSLREDINCGAAALVTMSILSPSICY